MNSLIKTEISSKKIGLRIVMDKKEIYPGDPGAGTPVIVETYDKRFSASWNCATETGELGLGDFLLSEAQIDWLTEHEESVAAWMRANGV